MKTRTTMKKSIHEKTCKESGTFPKHNVKPNGIMPSKIQTAKENIIIANVVLTPHLRKSLNKLSLSKSSSDRTTINHNSMKNRNISRFTKHKENLPHSNSKGNNLEHQLF